jgi:hypothetical protein
MEIVVKPEEPNPKTPPPHTGPDRQVPTRENFPDDRAYQKAMGEWYVDVEDNPKDDPKLAAYLAKRMGR